MKLKSTHLAALTCAAFFGSTALSQATVLVSEDFSYGDGGLNGQNGGTGFSGGWESSANVSGGAVVSTGGNYPSFRNLSTAFASSGTLWASFDWGHNTDGVGYGGLTLWVGGTEVALIGDVYNGTWQVAGAGASSTSSRSSMKTGVAKITLGEGATSTVELWVGPTGSPVYVGGPFVSKLSGLSLAGVDRIRIMGDSAQSFDNLVIGESMADVDATDINPYVWTGAANTNFTDPANWVGNAWTQWIDYTFGGTPTNATVTINGYFGIGSLTLQSGLTTDIVIDSTPNPVIMGTDQSGSSATITIAAASSNLTINGSYIASTAVTWDVGAGRTLTLNGPLNNWYNPASLVKKGEGTAVLNGASSYTGLTRINAGMLVASNNTALGAGGFRGDTMAFIADGATLALQGNISLDEHFHVWGTGVGGLGAVRSLGGNNALTCSYLGGAGYCLRTNTIVGVVVDSLTVTGFYEEGGSFSLTKVGAGTLVLTASTYTGGTTINGGTLIAGAGGVAKGAVTLASGTTLATTAAASTGLAALYYNNAAISQDNIASLSALLAHFGPNSPAPSLVLTAPSMNFGGDGFGFPAPYNSGGANFESFYSGKVDIATPGTYTFNTSSDDGSMLFIDGQVVVQNNFFQGVATRTGSIYLAAGMHDIVIAFNQGGGGYGMNAQMSGPDNTTMVDINTSNASITPDLVVGSLAGEGNVALTTGNLLMGIDNSSTDFSGAISGIGGVTKFGSGVQTLSGANTYSGATTISAGTLRIDGNSSGALGALTVEAGAFLGGTGSYGGNITLKDGSGMSAELNLTDCTLTCGGQLSFSNLDFAHCTFTVGTGAGYPPYRTFTLIEAASLGTVTFTNAEGMIDGVPAKLYINDNKLMLRVGRQGTYVSFF